VIQSKDITNVVIATPTPTHFKLAKLFLEAGKRVLIEKPATMDYTQALELGVLAKKKKLTLMTDYTFLYNPAVEKIKEFFNENQLGNINYIDCTRINLGIHQKETNVLWDLACHDVSVVNYLIKEKPEYVRAIGRVNRNFQVEELAYLFFQYPSGLLVQIRSSWASPVKIRQIVIGGDKKMLIFDDLEPTNKLKIYEYDDTNVKEDDSKKELKAYRLGNVSFPMIKSEEPLENMIKDFLQAACNDSKPKIEYQDTLDIIKYLERANESIKNNGMLVKI
jgi:predicted dehydrogenase